MGLFLCFKKNERRERNGWYTGFMKQCRLLSIDELVELAGYGLEWIIEDGHITAAVLLEEAS